MKYKQDTSLYDENGDFLMPKPWSYYENQPNFVYKYDSLFPNYSISHLDIEEDLIWYKKTFIRFKEKLNDITSNERDLLKFVKENRGAFILTSLLRFTDFGHHERFIFPEFCLADYYKVDYLIIGRASGGYQFLFVELESPYGQITTNKGEFSVAINKGIRQVKDWRRWIPKNYSSILQTLKKYKGPNSEFSKEFYELDIDRLHFIVLAGRRSDYTDLTYQIRREMIHDGNQIKVLHYDNLIDSAEKVIYTKSW